MKENIFIHKVLPILAIFILVTFVFINNNCFAGMDFTVTDEIIKKSENIAGINNYIILTDYSTVFLLVLPTDVSRVYVEKSSGYGGEIYNYINNTTNNGLFTLYRLSNNEFIGGTTHITFNQVRTFSFWYSTIDIMEGSKGDTVFFQKTPVVVIPILETAEQIPTAMATTLRLIIPIGLIILSMVLVIYLTKSVIWRMK